eukprot:scaffold485644_cov52-Prasinocladus_malaysianus.AAC.3
MARKAIDAVDTEAIWSDVRTEILTGRTARQQTARRSTFREGSAPGGMTLPATLESTSARMFM